MTASPSQLMVVYSAAIDKHGPEIAADALALHDTDGCDFSDALDRTLAAYREALDRVFGT